MLVEFINLDIQRKKLTSFILIKSLNYEQISIIMSLDFPFENWESAKYMLKAGFTQISLFLISIMIFCFLFRFRGREKYNFNGRIYVVIEIMNF